MSELITDVEQQTQADVVAGVTTKEEEAVVSEPTTEEPRRRGRPRKVVEPVEEESAPTVTRRKSKAKRQSKSSFYGFKIIFFHISSVFVLICERLFRSKHINFSIVTHICKKSHIYFKSLPYVLKFIFVFCRKRGKAYQARR
jgi:hypothetical protein